MNDRSISVTACKTGELHLVHHEMSSSTADELSEQLAKMGVTNRRLWALSPAHGHHRSDRIGCCPRVQQRLIMSVAIKTSAPAGDASATCLTNVQAVGCLGMRSADGMQAGNLVETLEGERRPVAMVSALLPDGSCDLGVVLVEPPTLGATTEICLRGGQANLLSGRPAAALFSRPGVQGCGAIRPRAGRSGGLFRAAPPENALRLSEVAHG